MTIQTIQVAGFEPAMLAMRAPLASWSKSDSKVEYAENTLASMREDPYICLGYQIGQADKELSLKLQKAGPEHCKHLRQIVVWAEISSPREFLIQLDTYRYGVEKVSCSTMHTLMRRPLEPDDFEHDSMNDDYLYYMIDSINGSMLAYNLEKDPERKKEIWRGIIEALPQSYIQKRYYMFSYAALRNIVWQRAGHKLKEWAQFIDWCHTLPESWMLFDE